MTSEIVTSEDNIDDSQKGKYLIFPLAKVSYGIGIKHVLEVVIWNAKIKITQIPHMPDYTKGVINLRGKVIPIIDLHLRFV